ncbi:MAG TPA: hypothetical protein VGQ83_26690 [Polyangia bacterium]
MTNVARTEDENREQIEAEREMTAALGGHEHRALCAAELQRLADDLERQAVLLRTRAIAARTGARALLAGKP